MHIIKIIKLEENIYSIIVYEKAMKVYKTLYFMASVAGRKWVCKPEWTRVLLVRWLLRNWCARREQSLLKTVYQIESSHKARYFSPKRPIFLHAGATYFELPSDISAMEWTVCFPNSVV